MTVETITVELPMREADALAARADEARVAISTATSRQMTGETALVNVVLPLTLTAVQVVAAFLIARRQGGGKEARSRITVKRKLVVAEEFTLENISSIVGHPLDG